MHGASCGRSLLPGAVVVLGEQSRALGGAQPVAGGQLAGASFVVGEFLPGGIAVALMRDLLPGLGEAQRPIALAL